MKKFVLGLAAGLVVYEAMVQLVWVGGRFDEWTEIVNNRLSNDPLRSRLRERLAELEAQRDSERNVTIDLGTLNPGEFQAEVDRIIREARRS